MKKPDDDRRGNRSNKAYCECTDSPDQCAPIGLVGRGAGADDRIEQRRNHHGADNDGRAVHPETQGANRGRRNGQQQVIEVDFRALREIKIGS